MRDYYEAELRLLHESAQEFARAYPEEAGMLNLNELKDRDPYIERLLEGMAFLTAQIRQHIDDDIPEISETLLNQLWPHFLRAYPSATIVQFSPRIGQLQQTQKIKKDTVLLTSPVGDDRVICRFRTSSDVTLHPIRISQFSLDEPAGGGTVIKLGFQLDSGIGASDLELDTLKLYLNADPALALWLHHQLTGEINQVRIRFPEHPTKHAHELGRQAAVQPAHMQADDAMVNLSGRSFHGFHLIQDFFCFREKYMFVDINGLDKVAWPRQCQQFDLEIHIKGICPQDHNLRKETFALHCSPATNLFEQNSEPVYLDHRRTSYQVVADVGARDGLQVYSLDRVIGLDTETGERHEYYPMYTFQHRQKNGRYFNSHRRVSGNGRPETYLSVGGSKELRSESLSCTITATNGSYPRRHLRENSITTPSVDFPSYASFKNLTRPSRSLEPPERKKFQWDLISHLSLNYSSLTSLDVLKRVLNLYDWTEDEQNRRRIDGIRKINVESIERVRKGALMRGLEIRLTVSEENYRSVSDIHLFGMLLHRFFSMYATVNCFVRTRISCYPSNKELTWEPLLGENSPI